VIVILPNSAGPIRTAVKHWGDIRYGTSSVSFNLLYLKFPVFSGVTTQCLRLEKFLAANNQYWNNVALKYVSSPLSCLFFPHPYILKRRINARLGGCNSTSDSGVLAGLQSQPFMIVGESWTCSS
jgi:eukaryotic translation initiation factor 2C